MSTRPNQSGVRTWRWLLASGLLVVGVFVLRTPVNQAASVWQPTVIPPEVQTAQVRFRTLVTVPPPTIAPFSARTFAFGGGRKTSVSPTGETIREAVGMIFDGFNWKATVVPQVDGGSCQSNSGIFGLSDWVIDANNNGAPDASDYHHVRAVGSACNAAQRSTFTTAKVTLNSVITTSPTPWTDCRTHTDQSCLSGRLNNVFIYPDGSDARAWALSDVDFLDANTGIAVGNNCDIWRTTNGGLAWSRLGTAPDYVLPGCIRTRLGPQNQFPGFPATAQQWVDNHFTSNIDLRAVAYAQDYSAGSVDALGNRRRRTESTGAYVWIVGEQKQPQVDHAAGTPDTDNVTVVWFSSNGGTTWSTMPTFPAAGTPARQHWHDVQAVYEGGVYSVLISGSTANTGPWPAFQTREARLRALQCDNVAGGLPNCTAGPTFGSATSVSDGRVPFGSGYLQTDLGQIAIIKDSSATPKFHAWVTAGTNPVYNDGQILYSDAPFAGANAAWGAQGVTTNQDLYAVAATSLTRAWAAGDAGTFMQLTPSNLSGWAWFGGDGCTNSRSSPSDPCTNGPQASEPLGWVSLTCANSQTCAAQQAFTYGVSVKPLRQKTTFNCTANPLNACSTDADCPGSDTCNTAPAACTDTNQAIDVGALSGFAWTGAIDLSQLDPGPSLPCDQSGGDDACVVSGWLGFERVGNCTESVGVICRSNADCDNSPTDSCVMNPPTPPFGQLPTTTACNKTIQPSTSNSYVVATLDFNSDRVEGWAHFLGDGYATSNTGWVRLRGPYRCGTAYCSQNRNRTCTSDAQCSGFGVCDTSLQDANDLRTCTAVTTGPGANLLEHYDSCTDCTTDTQGDSDPSNDTLTCKICTHIQAIDWWDKGYTKRRLLTVTAPGGVVLNSTMTASYYVDANTLAAQADFDDLRLVYKSPTGFVELDREVVASTGGIEEVRFRIAKQINANQSDANYYLYFNNGSAPTAPSDPKRVYAHYEDFSTDVITSGAWTYSSGCFSRFSVSGGRLRYNGTGAGDCFSYDTRTTGRFPLRQGMINIEGTVRISSSANIHQGGWAMFSSPNYIWLDALKRSAADDKLFVKTVEGTDLYAEDGPLGSEIGTSDHLLRWRYIFVSDSLRQHIGYLSGQQWLRPAGVVDDNVSQMESAQIGVHAFNTSIVEWDNLHVWQELAAVSGGATVDYNAASPSLVPVNGALERWACNVCGTTGSPGTQCGIGRCSPTSPPGHEYRTCLNDQQCGGGSGTCEPVGRCSNSGAVCFTTAECGGGGTCTNIGENTCNSCASCQLYGVSVDAKGGSATGFAYSDDVGYVDFSLAYLYSRSWLQVLKGSIYSRGDVGSGSSRQAPALESVENSPATSCNATFVIRANGSIINQCAEQQLASPESDSLASPFLRPGFTAIDLPQPGNNFRTDTDRLDIPGLVTVVNAATQRNKYGNVVVVPDPAITTLDELVDAGLLGPQHCLGNKVLYFHNRDFTIDADPVFAPCASGGRGTILISGGNLIVTGNTSYNTSTGLTRLTDLPALGIIVVPDHTNPAAGPVSVTIRPQVTQSVGNYFVAGAIVVETYSSATLPDQQFVHQGVMVASQFRLNRRFGGSTTPEPSEKIINDGRVTLNPPPGFESLSAQLPSLRDARP